MHKDTLTFVLHRVLLTAVLLTNASFLSAAPYISEFSATGNSLDDEDGDSSDWIEIHNPDATPIDLSGWSLTDESDLSTLWTLPSVTIPADSYLVVFASGKDRTTLPLHTDFSLEKSGEYLALLDPGNAIISEYAPEYPPQVGAHSYGYSLSGLDIGYLETPTPEAPNDPVVYQGLLTDTNFAIGRGFYTSAFDETVTSDDPGVTLVYTIDGSEPSLTNGTQILPPDANTPATGLVNITTTTTLRLKGFKTNYIPTNVDTQTYLFLDDVLDQPSSPPGWPTGTVNGQVLDYHMDPASSINTNDASILEDLQAIPSISIVTDQDHLLDPVTGIYSNPQERGYAWERPTSVELIFPDSYVSPDGHTEGFQVEAGIRIRGGYSRDVNNPKHAFRLFFREEYGDSKLEFPLFGDEGTDKYDKVDLRTAQNYSWSYKGDSRNTFLREVFGRDTQRDLDQPYTRSRYYHLYLNGLYWGLFMTQERSEADFGASYFGGDDDDYDTVKSGGIANGYEAEMTDGTNVDWIAGYNLTSDYHYGPDLATDNDAYFEIQGLNTLGVRDTTLPIYYDIENLIDYMLIIFYTGSFDAPISSFSGNEETNNWYGVRNRETDDTGWSFFAHDLEHSLGTRVESTDRTGPYWVEDTAPFEDSNPQYLHQHLLKNDEYRLAFADITHREFFNEGVFTNSTVLARIAPRKTVVDSVIHAEAARWGDANNRHPYKKSNWLSAVSDLENWVIDRNLTVLDQLRVDGLYPDLDAPVFSQHGGQVLVNYNLTMTNPDATGTIYYTTDGSDPRLIGGSVSSTASAGTSLTITSPVTVNARIQDSSGTWSALASATFVTAPPPTPGDILITELHYHPSDPTAAEIAAGHDNDDDFEFLELTNVSTQPLDLSGLTLANGLSFDFSALDPTNYIIPAGGKIVIVEDAAAFAFRHGATTIMGVYTGGLSNGGETIDLFQDGTTLIDSVTYSDDAPWPEAPDGDNYSLVLRNPDNAPDSNSPLSWRASYSSDGSPGSSNSSPFTGTATDDLDGNDIPDLLETVLQNGSSSYHAPEITFQTEDENPHEFPVLSVTYNRVIDNAQLIIEGSDDLSLWQESGIDLFETETLDAGITTKHYRSNNPAGFPQFFQVKVGLLTE